MPLVFHLVEHSGSVKPSPLIVVGIAWSGEFQLQVVLLQNDVLRARGKRHPGDKKERF
jgi:hypothetical protein